MRINAVKKKNIEEEARSYFTLQYRDDKGGGGSTNGVVVGQKNYANRSPCVDTFLPALPPLARYYSDSKKH